MTGSFPKHIQSSFYCIRETTVRLPDYCCEVIIEDRTIVQLCNIYVVII